MPEQSANGEYDVSTKRVAILVCTYSGEQYLARQLDTVIEQTHDNWCIYASDDGSTDKTWSILSAYRDRIGPSKMKIFKGPGRGFVANFFSLLARPGVSADFYTFTDQDDEWDLSRLERSLRALSKVDADVPALYGSRSEIIDAEGRHVGYSRPFARPSGFANALVQNMVSGNTMVLNHAAADLMRKAGTDVSVSAHDWWAYLLVTGCGGKMIYDPYPTIRYRQHSENLYGPNISFRALASRAARLVAGDFRQWTSMNLEALRSCWSLLDEKSQRQVELFSRAREGTPLTRLRSLQKSRVYRQTWDGQLGLMVAALIRQI